jgi:hypothetical protein
MAAGFYSSGLSSKWAGFDAEHLAILRKAYVPQNLVGARAVAVHCAERGEEANGIATV